MGTSLIYWLECHSDEQGVRRQSLLYNRVDMFILKDDYSIKAVYYKGVDRYDLTLLEFKGEEDFDRLVGQRSLPQFNPEP